MLLLFAYHESNEVKWGENEQNSHGVLLLTLNMRYFTFNARIGFTSWSVIFKQRLNSRGKNLPDFLDLHWSRWQLWHFHLKNICYLITTILYDTKYHAIHLY